MKENRKSYSNNTGCFGDCGRWDDVGVEDDSDGDVESAAGIETVRFVAGRRVAQYGVARFGRILNHRIA